MHRRWGRARLLLAIVMAGVLALSACGGDDDEAADTSGGDEQTDDTAADGSDDEADDGDDAGGEADILGEPDPASGEPVKIGLVTNGTGQGFDQSHDEPIAKAAAEWINEYRGGIGGRPIEIVACEDKQDPGRAADCANELIQEDVVAVVYSSNGIYEASWRPLSEAGIPTFIQATGGQTAGAEPTNTFQLNNSLASTIDGPIGLAKDQGADVVSVIAVDVPAATVNYVEGPGPQKFEDAGIELDLIPVPLGTPDMTVQTQQLVEKNPDGVVNILGNDAFCIAALSGLRTAGYSGVISANESCITENTVEAVGADYVEGIRVVGQTPIGDLDDPSTQLYKTVMETWAPDEDPLNPNGGFVFLAMTGLDTATQELEGEVTSESIIEAAKSMEWLEQPGSGGRHIRCNGKADETQPAVCSNAVLYATLDGDGHPAEYEVVLDEEIPD